MKTLTMIEMAGCPYCANAHRAINALKAEGGAYADVPVEYIDENAEPERTKPYAGMYYYVPSLFVGGENTTKRSRDTTMRRFSRRYVLLLTP